MRKKVEDEFEQEEDPKTIAIMALVFSLIAILLNLLSFVTHK
jgi:hypothetical protein